MFLGKKKNVDRNVLGDGVREGAREEEEKRRQDKEKIAEAPVEKQEVVVSSRGNDNSLFTIETDRIIEN